MYHKRGEIWWADLEEPRGSESGYRRPVVIVQSDDFNKSRIGTIIVAVLTSNLQLGKAPGNVKLQSGKKIGIKRASVINSSQLITLDKSYLSEKIGQISPEKQLEFDDGLKLVLNLS